MSFLDDMSTISVDNRRIELARLLATGLIRVLLHAKTKTNDENEDSDTTSADGLDDS